MTGVQTCALPICTPNVTESQIKEKFVKAFNNLITNKDEVIKDCENAILSLTNTQDLDGKISRFKEECKIVVELMKDLIHENTRKAMNQDKYTERYNAYTEKYEKIKSELSKLEGRKQDLKVRKEKIKIFIDDLKNNDNVISEFDERLWYSLVEKVVAHSGGKKEFKFKYSD